MDEAVCESGGAGTEALIPSPRGQEAERVVGVAHNHGRYSGEAVCVF